jgi:hypothetical protein
MQMLALRKSDIGQLLDLTSLGTTTEAAYRAAIEFRQNNCLHWLAQHKAPFMQLLASGVDQQQVNDMESSEVVELSYLNWLAFVCQLQLPLQLWQLQRDGTIASLGSAACSLGEQFGINGRAFNAMRSAEGNYEHWELIVQLSGVNQPFAWHFEPDRKFCCTNVDADMQSLAGWDDAFTNITFDETLEHLAPERYPVVSSVSTEHVQFAALDCVLDSAFEPPKRKIIIAMFERSPNVYICTSDFPARSLVRTIWLSKLLPSQFTVCSMDVEQQQEADQFAIGILQDVMSDKARLKDILMWFSDVNKTQKKPPAGCRLTHFNEARVELSASSVLASSREPGVTKAAEENTAAPEQHRITRSTAAAEGGMTPMLNGASTTVARAKRRAKARSRSESPIGGPASRAEPLPVEDLVLLTSPDSPAVKKRTKVSARAKALGLTKRRKQPRRHSNPLPAKPSGKRKLSSGDMQQSDDDDFEPPAQAHAKRAKVDTRTRDRTLSNQDSNAEPRRASAKQSRKRKATALKVPRAASESAVRSDDDDFVAKPKKAKPSTRSAQSSAKPESAVSSEDEVGKLKQRKRVAASAGKQNSNPKKTRKRQMKANALQNKHEDSAEQDDGPSSPLKAKAKPSKAKPNPEEIHSSSLASFDKKFDEMISRLTKLHHDQEEKQAAKESERDQLRREAEQRLAVDEKEKETAKLLKEKEERIEKDKSSSAPQLVMPFLPYPMQMPMNQMPLHIPQLQQQMQQLPQMGQLAQMQQQMPQMGQLAQIHPQASFAQFPAFFHPFNFGWR